MTTPGANPERIPEERVSAILTRAAELDKQTQASVALDTIREAAVEAGISLSAVDRALEEYATSGVIASEPSPAPSAPKPGMWRKLLVKTSEAITYGVLGILMGAWASRGEAGASVALLGYILVALHLVFRDRPTRSAARFLQLITITFAGSMLMYLPEGNEDLSGWTAIVWAALVPVGVLAIKTVPRVATLEEIKTTS